MQDWLFSSGNCTWEHDFQRRERASFRRGPVKAYLEEVPVFPGIWLYRAEAGGQGSRFSIEAPRTGSGDGRIILGTMLAGRGVLALEGCEDQTWREDGRAFSLSPVARHTRYDVVTDNGWRSVAVRLETEALDLLAGDGQVPDMVRRVLEGRVDNLNDVAPISGPLRAASHILLRPPYEGPMQALFRQAKVLELMAYLFDRFGAEEEAGSLSPAELARVRLARDRILADLRDAPSLEQLSLDVGLSPKRLNRGFRHLYGTTVFNYLRDARLDAARHALESGTPLPLKQLSWELGYGQVSNFVTAFRRRFGVTPGAWQPVEEEG